MYGQPPRSGVDQVHILCMSKGMSCDGDSVSVTAAMRPSLEDVVLGLLPGLPGVHLHNKALDPSVGGDDFMRTFRWHVRDLRRNSRHGRQPDGLHGSVRLPRLGFPERRRCSHCERARTASIMVVQAPVEQKARNLVSMSFGVEVVRRLADRKLPDGVQVVDFGIRGFDLAHALMDSDATAVLVDATPRGGEPGTLYLLEAALDASEPNIETHGMHPATVLRLVEALGGRPPRVLVVGCEPANVDLDEEGQIGLSPAVEAAVEQAVQMIESLVNDLGGSSA